MEAEHAEAALVIVQVHALRIQVLFTDIRMHGAMEGFPFAHHTAKHWPRIALLISSARPRPERQNFLRKADFWQNHIGITTMFVIFESLWQPHDVGWSRKPDFGRLIHAVSPITRTACQPTICALMLRRCLSSPRETQRQSAPPSIRAASCRPPMSCAGCSRASPIATRRERSHGSSPDGGHSR